MSRRHPPSLVNPADVVRAATDRQLGMIPARTIEFRIDQAERLLARHDGDIAKATPQAETLDVPEIDGPAGPPTIAVTAAAGSTATATITGHDEAGLIQLIPGGTGIATGEQLIISFALARPSSNYVIILQAVSSAARTIGTAVGPATRATGSWRIRTDSVLTSGSTYQWFYRLGQY